MLPSEPLYPVISNETSTGIGQFLGIFASAPSNPEEGNTYINSTDNGYYIFYGGTWQLLHTLTPSTPFFLLLEDGFYLLQEDTGKLILQP